MKNIIHIGSTSIDFGKFLYASKQVLNYSISESIDKNNIKNEQIKFLAALREMKKDEVVDPAKAVREAGSLLRHINTSFLCVLPEKLLNGVREETDLAINSCEGDYNGLKLAVITGNLEQWRNAVVNCSSDRLDIQLRELANDFMNMFESLGLNQLWAAFAKTGHPIKLLPR